MDDDEEGDREYDTDCPGHAELPDDDSREYGYHRKSQPIHCSDLSIGSVSFSLRDEYRHESGECYHADIAHENPEHRHQDKNPEPGIPHIGPSWLRKYEEHREGYRVEKQRYDRWCEHHMFFAVMIHEWAEPYSSEEIEYQVYSSEHTCHKNWARFEVRPECDCKPQEHIGEASYGWVCEDVREEGLGFHDLI